MPIVEKEATSVSQYLSIVSGLIAEWSSPESGEIRPWFRGHKRADWNLVPGEFRFTDINPDEIRSEFVLKARALLDDSPTTDWEWYFLMQHHGLPTRLLDWTAGSLIGLHFAVCHDTGESDAAVWVLDPWRLNKWSISKSELVLSADSAAKKYLHPVYHQKKIPRRPIAIVPPYNSPRITVQRGAFSVHGSNRDGIDEQFATRLAKIHLAKDCCIEMRRELRCAGISEFTLFPDLDGLSRDIRGAEIEGC